MDSPRPANLVPVSRLDDPRLEPYRDVRDRDLASSGVFLAESDVVLRVLVGRRTHPVESVLLAESRVAKLGPLLGDLPPAVPVFVAPQAVLDSLAGFHLHRGVLACARRTEVPDAATFLGELPAGPGTLVVLEGLTNHDNVGAIFRNAAALGASGILLDARTCDPLYRKAIRVSVGGCLVVPYGRCGTTVETLSLLESAGFTTVALTPNEPAVELATYRPQRPERVALLLGSEGPGLEAETLARVAVRVRIRQRAEFDSLNVATACGIALHALALG